MAKPVQTALVALLIGAAGGWVFWLLGAPLPWTLGAMFASGLAATLNNRWPMPREVRSFARPVVGVLAGSAFTPAVVDQLVEWWPAMLFIAGYTATTSIIGFLVFTRLSKFDPVTAYFASVPGGLSEMSLLGGSLGGSVRTLVLVHAVRILGVIFAIPAVLQLVVGHELVRGAVDANGGNSGAIDWLLVVGSGVAGYYIGKHSRLPGGSMVGAMVCSAVLHASGLSSAVPPAWLIAFVQVLLGSVIGGYFAGVSWGEVRTTIVAALGWSVVLVGLALIAALLGSSVLAIPLETALLAIAPGGTAEMIIITYALGGEVAFVASCQVLRILLVFSCTPLFIPTVVPQDRPLNSSKRPRQE